MTDHDEIIEMRMELSQLRKELDELEVKVSYYDRLALKWGGACMGMIALGAIISNHLQKLFEKLFGLISQ
jgi:hypothetical protein